MSSAVVCCRSSGRPVALWKKVCAMPSWRALAVIISLKWPSLPPTASATVTAASFADPTTIALIASSTGIALPSRRRMCERGCSAALADTARLGVEFDSVKPQLLEQQIERHHLVSEAGRRAAVALRGIEDAAGPGLDHQRGIEIGIGEHAAVAVTGVRRRRGEGAGQQHRQGAMRNPGDGLPASHAPPPQVVGAIERRFRRAGNWRG